MNGIPKSILKSVMIGHSFQPSLANRKADDLDYKGRLAYLDGRIAHAKKFSRYANKLRQMALKSA